jgi:hypothetical protein
VRAFFIVGVCGGVELCRGLRTRQYIGQIGEYMGSILQYKSIIGEIIALKGEIIGVLGEINPTRLL